MSAYINRVVEQLKVDEGFRAFVYDDATGKPLKKGDTIKGHPTVGYGTELSKRGIEEEEAEYLMRRDLAKIVANLNSQVFFKHLDDARKAVIVNMCYQMGINGFLKFKRFINSLIMEDYTSAARHGLNSKWAREQSPARAKRLMEIVEHGK